MKLESKFWPRGPSSDRELCKRISDDFRLVKGLLKAISEEPRLTEPELIAWRIEGHRSARRVVDWLRSMSRASPSLDRQSQRRARAQSRTVPRRFADELGRVLINVQMSALGREAEIICSIRALPVVTHGRHLPCDGRQHCRVLHGPPAAT